MGSSPRAAAKGTMPAAMGNTDTAVGSGVMTDMNTMGSTGSRTSRTKFLKWFHSLSPRQGQVDEHEVAQLERSRCCPLAFLLEHSPAYHEMIICMKLNLLSHDWMTCMQWQHEVWGLELMLS